MKVHLLFGYDGIGNKRLVGAYRDMKHVDAQTLKHHNKFSTATAAYVKDETIPTGNKDQKYDWFGVMSVDVSD